MKIRVKKKKADKLIVCQKCGHSWKASQGGKDPFTCHKCGSKGAK
jgi:hypothetical protein